MSASVLNRLAEHAIHEYEAGNEYAIESDLMAQPKLSEKVKGWVVSTFLDNPQDDQLAQAFYRLVTGAYLLPGEPGTLSGGLLMKVWNTLPTAAPAIRELDLFYDGCDDDPNVEPDFVRGVIEEMLSKQPLPPDIMKAIVANPQKALARFNINLPEFFPYAQSQVASNRECPAALLASILSKGQADKASLAASEHPNAPKAAVAAWLKRIRSTPQGKALLRDEQELKNVTREMMDKATPLLSPAQPVGARLDKDAPRKQTIPKQVPKTKSTSFQDSILEKYERGEITRDQFKAYIREATFNLMQWNDKRAG